MRTLCNFFVFGILAFFMFSVNAEVVTTQSNNQKSAVISPAESASVESAAALPVSTLLNINSADATELHKIKGISKKKAQAIVSYRTKNGPFKTVSDLAKIKCKGINKKWLTKTEKFLTV
jgi:competence protein ComEA